MAGLTHSLVTFLAEAYAEDEVPNAKDGVDKRVVLRLNPRLSPIKTAVPPLSHDKRPSPLARELAAELRRSWSVDFGGADAVGRRHCRQDEIGTPFYITVDFDFLEDRIVAIRDRDTTEQIRLPIADVEGRFTDRLARC